MTKKIVKAPAKAAKVTPPPTKAAKATKSAPVDVDSDVPVADDTAPATSPEVRKHTLTRTEMNAVLAEFKDRGRTPNITNRDQYVIRAWLDHTSRAKFSNKENIAAAVQEIIQARVDNDKPNGPPGFDPIPDKTDHFDTAPPVSAKAHEAKHPPEKQPADMSPENEVKNLTKGFELEGMEVPDGAVYMRYGIPTTPEKARAYCAYYARALRTVLQVVDVKTNETLMTFDGRHLRQFVAPTDDKPVPEGSPKVRKASGNGERKAGKPGRYSTTNPDDGAKKAFELAQRKSGVKKSQLVKDFDAGGKPTQWPWILQKLAEKNGKQFKQDKSNGEPTFYVT